MRPHYLLLGVAALYCLFQSVRFRIAASRHRRRSPDMVRAASAAILGSEEGMKEAFLTETGREHLFKHRMYDAVGVLAAGMLIFLWLYDVGAVDFVFEQM